MNPENINKLETYLRDELSLGDLVQTRVHRLAYGAIQENWKIECTSKSGKGGNHGTYVLRTDAAAKLPTSHSRSLEFELLKIAFSNGCKVPKPIRYVQDSSIVGKPFFLMKFIPGQADARKLTGLERPRAQGNALVANLGRELARIHKLAEDDELVALLPIPEQKPVTHVIATYRRFLDLLPVSAPVLEYGLRWAELNQPDSQRYVFCHRDFRTGNIMVDGNQVTGILDWEFADWSDPMEDVAWFCAKCWRFLRPDLEAGGIGHRNVFYSAYEEASGRPIHPRTIAFWEIMAHIRWAMIARQQGERFSSDNEPNLEAGLTAYIAPELELEILNQIEKFAK